MKKSRKGKGDLYDDRYFWNFGRGVRGGQPYFDPRVCSYGGFDFLFYSYQEQQYAKVPNVIGSLGGGNDFGSFTVIRPKTKLVVGVYV